MFGDPFGSNVNKRDMVLVFVFGVGVGILNEFVSWIFIYRTEKFKKMFNDLCDSYETYIISKVLPLPKSVYQGGESPSHALLRKVKKIQTKKTLSGVLTGMLLMGFMPAIMSMFEYSVVAKLPFKPFPFLTLFTHSKLLGNDPTDCTATAIYTLISMLTRQYMRVFLGCESPLTPFRESVVKDEVKKEGKKK